MSRFSALVAMVLALVIVGCSSESSTTQSTSGNVTLPGSSPEEKSVNEPSANPDIEKDQAAANGR